jgi:hypothetical protein
MKRIIYKALLPRIVARLCESRIPRSGAKGAAVNCYVVTLDDGESPYFVATGFENDTLIGLKWDGTSYAEHHQISISEIERWRFGVTHYYGLSEITFGSIIDFAWHYATRLVYIRSRTYRYLDSAHQYLFNKKKLITKRRMDLLRFMMDDQMDRSHDGIRITALMSKLYTMRLFLHPSWEVQERKVELYLDSLVHSGELRKVNDEYVVSGAALSTLETYEEEERRHTEAVKLQTRMFWLALIAAMFALVQTGLIKLPTVLDLS